MKHISVSIYREYQNKKFGTEYKGLTIEANSIKEVALMIQRLIDAQHLSHFSKMKVTAIEVREKKNRKWKNKGIYFSFRGLSPAETKELLIQHLKK